MYTCERFISCLLYVHYDSANTRPLPNASLMLGRRHRRWPNIKPTLNQRRVFAEITTHCDEG